MTKSQNIQIQEESLWDHLIQPTHFRQMSEVRLGEMKQTSKVTEINKGLERNLTFLRT